MLSLLMCLIKDSQSTQSNKVAIALNYLEKEASHNFFSYKVENKVLHV